MPRTLPQINYEGFESSPQYQNDPTVSYTGLDTLTEQSPSKPLFELGSVQYTLPSPLVSFTSSASTLTLAFQSNTLQQLSLADATSILNISLGKKGPESPIYKTFADPTGKHLIITTFEGENFYCFNGWTRARLLPKCKMVIESVAWNPYVSSTSQRTLSSNTTTKEILLGARNGSIYETLLDAHDDIFKTPDRYVQLIYTLPDKQPVLGLASVGLSSAKGGSSAERRVAILATTATRIYQFVGVVDRKTDEVGKLYESVFAPYKEAVPKFLDLPGTIQHSELHVTAGLQATTAAWLTAQGIYHGTLNLSTSTADIIDSASLLSYPYPPHSAGVPISILVTEFHFLLLYPDRVCAVSSLDEKLVWEEILALKPNERPIGLSADTSSPNPRDRTYWIYTNSSMYEIRSENEDQSIWKVYLDLGKFKEALNWAKTPSQRAVVNASLADEYFTAEQYIQAAQCYAQSSRGFEEVALKFGDVGETDAQRYFLVCRLERVPKSALTQRMMLATWLVEIYLGKLNTLDDVVASEGGASRDVENLKAERTMIEDELKQFFETYKANLHKQTVYELILSHGRTDLFLYYATIVSDFERVIEHHVMNEEWLLAVDVLNRQSNLELYYRFSPVLMRHAPKEMVDSWLRQNALDPHRLIPALLQTQHAAPSPLTPNHAVRYLNHVVFSAGSTSPMIHNLLLTFLASPSPSLVAASPVSSPIKLPNGDSTVSTKDANNGPLLRFLSTAPTDPLANRPYYDLDYALRLCKRNGRAKACVHIYAQMGMWEESVALALEMGDVELAKENAERVIVEDGDVENEALRKKLWLMIAKFVVKEKKDIKTAMRFLDNTSVLKIEDILPFFPDFVVIDDFKDEICNALEGYSAHIDELKAEMNEATATAEAIRKDMADLKTRFVVAVEQSDKCVVCENELLTRQFYVFPCQHVFHADCLIGQVKEYLPSHTLRKILHLQNELVRITSGASLGDRKAHSRQATVDAQAATLSPDGPTAAQRALLSANFGINKAVVAPANALTAASRNVFAAAGAGIRDLIIPESLASAISGNLNPLNVNLNLVNPMAWAAVANGGGKEGGKDSAEKVKERVEKVREELDELLASGCPLCESVVAGLDKPFVVPEEVDQSWEL